MKILYDHQIFTLQNVGGISRYHAELINNFHSNNKCNPVFPVILSNNCYLDSIKINHIKFFSTMQIPGKCALMNKINNIIAKNNLKKQDFDLFHPTYYDSYFLKYLKNKPFVVTIHDMIYEIYPEYFTDAKKIQQSKKSIAESSEKIIAVSHHTKADILKFYKIESDKIQVIHHGNYFKNFLKNRKWKNNKTNNFLLFVGNRNGYKNFKFFIESITPFLLRNKDINVICAGGSKFTPNEQEWLKSLNLMGRIQYAPVTDEKLANLYKHAKAFIFPSLYEGFGLPILEAFTFGCPAILSNKSSLPEVGGNAACYFNPLDSESIISSIEKVILDPDYQIKLKSEGYKRLDNFSVHTMVEQTCKLYSSLI